MKDSKSKTTQAHPGVNYARIAGKLVGLLIIVLGIRSLMLDETANYGGGGFKVFKGAYFIIFGFLLNLPFSKVAERYWKQAFMGLVLISVGFVFTMIASVMFGYMTAADQGERLGVPGFEGTLIFLCLMQVPAILFEHRPDLLD